MKRKLYFYICVVICCCFALSNISMVEGGVEEEYIPSTTCEEKTVHEYYFNSELGVNIEEKSYEVKNSNEGDKGILDTILKSTVLVGIITALFNWRQHNNTNSLKYITEERQKWREKIRDIAKNIEAYQYFSDDKDKQKLKEILVELKVNINPYGRENEQEKSNKINKNYKKEVKNKSEKYQNKKDKKKKQKYLKDEHIWEAIRELEKNNKKNEFSKNKGKLIDYLSFLLKYDWERAKYEVEQKSLWIRGLKVYAIGGVLIIWFKILFKIHNIESVMYIDILYIIIIAFLFIVFSFILSRFKKINKWKNTVKIICTEIIFFSIIILSIKYYDMLVSDTNKNILSKVSSNLKSCLKECCIENIILIIAVSVYFIISYLAYIEDKQRYEIIQEDYIKQLEMVDGIEIIKCKKKI